MNDLAQLEAQLEKITEGIFARFFGKRVQAHDIALQLMRVLEEGLQPAHDGDLRPLAPDRYRIQVHPNVLRLIEERYPTLTQVLSEQIIELVNRSSYRLKTTPQFDFIADGSLSTTQIVISATVTTKHSGTTDALQPVKIATAHTAPPNPQLIISGQRVLALEQNIVSIGRSQTCDVVIEDAYVSRSHAQIRLRFGYYMIFDTDSQSGTYVNNVRIREHRLQAGDVIRIGSTSLVYMDDTDQQATESFDPVP